MTCRIVSLGSHCVVMFHDCMRIAKYYTPMKNDENAFKNIFYSSLWRPHCTAIKLITASTTPRTVGKKFYGRE